MLQAKKEVRHLHNCVNYSYLHGTNIGTVRNDGDLNPSRSKVESLFMWVIDYLIKICKRRSTNTQECSIGEPFFFFDKSSIAEPRSIKLLTDILFAIAHYFVDDFPKKLLIKCLILIPMSLYQFPNMVRSQEYILNQTLFQERSIIEKITIHFSKNLQDHNSIFFIY